MNISTTHVQIESHSKNQSFPPKTCCCAAVQKHGHGKSRAALPQFDNGQKACQSGGGGVEVVDLNLYGNVPSKIFSALK